MKERVARAREKFSGPENGKKLVLCSTDVFVRGKERLREGLKVDEATWAYVANLRGCVHRLLWFATSRATEPRHRREAP